MPTRGGSIFLDAGKQTLTSEIDITQDNAVSTGQGDSTFIVRGTDMPTGKGLINVTSNGSVISDMMIDGAVTTSVGVDRSTITDPAQASFVKNSLIWVHGGTSNLVIENITFQHGSGYCIFLDARAGNIDNVIVRNCTFLNCRPFLNGSGTDLNYGSWVGAIFYKNLSDGTNNFRVNGLTIDSCTFKRITGNVVWGHSNGFLTPNQNISVVNCFFEDHGLDGIELGNVSGFSVKGNRFHRCGYITTDDTSPSVPKYDSGFGALAIDTTSGTYNGSYEGNTMVSLTGGGIDADGLADAVIANNTIIIPDSTDPLYTQDSVATSGVHGGANVSYGIQPGNTFYAHGGRNIIITGNTIRNMGSRAISLSNAKDCIVTDNDIVQSGSSGFSPIIIFCSDNSATNGGSASDNRAHGNVITNNRIDYGSDTAATKACVAEINPSGHPFTSSDINRVYGNHITGTNYGEWSPDSNSGSYAGYAIPTEDNTSTSNDTSLIQRFGHGSGAATRISKNIAGTKSLLMQISDGGFLNVSVNAAAGTGAIGLANRSATAFQDVFAGGKTAVDAFSSWTDTTFADADANVLNDSYGLLRYVSASKKFQISTSVSVGARVWQDLITSTSVPGSNTQIVYNNSGAFGASANFTWDNTAQILTAGGVGSTGGIATNSTSTAALNAPSGGVTTKYLIGTTSLSISGDTSTNAGLSNVGSGRLYFDSTLNKFRVSENGGGYINLIGGSGVTSLTGTTNQVNVSASTGAITLSTPQNIDTSANITFNALALSSTATNALGIASGGVTAKFLIGTTSFSLTGDTSTNAGSSTAGNGRIYFDSTTHKFMVSENGGSYVQLVASSSGVTSITGTTNQVNASASTGAVTLSLPQSIDTGANVTFNALALGSTATNALGIASGGVTAKFLVGTTSFSLTGDTSTNAGSSTAGNGRIYFDSTLARFRVSENGGGYINLTGTGVTSVAAGTGISVSASTGAVTISNTGVTSVFAGTGISVNANTGSLTVTNTGVTSVGGSTGAVSLFGGTGVSVSGTTISIGQAVSTSSAVTFASVVANGVFNSTASGSSSAFQTNTGTVIITGAGAIGCQSVNSNSYAINGTTIINSSGFISAASGQNVNAGAAFTVAGSFFGIDRTGGLTVSTPTGSINLFFRGGILYAQT